LSDLLYKFWLVLLAIYIISPFDAFPLFFDDLIAACVMAYLIYSHSMQKEREGHAHSRQKIGENNKNISDSQLSLEEAYRILGLNAGATAEEISRAYKEKMARSHPDKVNHLSEELQEKAKEIALRLNHAYEVIQKNKKE